MTKLVDFEAVLSLVDKSISPTYLNPTQEIVLREVWNGKTYSEMAYQYNYDPEYIKSVGCNLWQTLSRTFDKQINKSNFVPFMRQRITQLAEEKKFQLEDYQEKPLLTNLKNQQVCHWTTAPNTKHFIGREEEIYTLDLWSQEPDCRCIIVSGMVGCGKTTLVTEFARKVKHQFDYVIWFSLLQPPSLITLLNKYLKLINQQPDEQIAPKYVESSFLLSEFITCLKRQKILLVLDDLQCLFKINQENIYYKKEFEEYGQFLRSIISTNHQSLLIATSVIKPKILEYYAGNQVSFLELQGLKYKNTKTFLKLEHSPPLNEQKLFLLSTILQDNPQLLKIVNNHLHPDDFSEDNIEQIAEEISLLEPIIDLLELELSYLSNLEKEIIYWLAISRSFISLEELGHYIEISQRKLNFLNSINCLIRRSLIIKNNSTYALMPIMKSYLRRKLVKQALQSKNS